MKRIVLDRLRAVSARGPTAYEKLVLTKTKDLLPLSYKSNKSKYYCHKRPLKNDTTGIEYQTYTMDFQGYYILGCYDSTR